MTTCYDGKDERTIYEDGDQRDDGTWDGTSVVCDACYIALGQPLLSEIPKAIAQVRAGR